MNHSTLVTVSLHMDVEELKFSHHTDQQEVVEVFLHLLHIQVSVLELLPTSVGEGGYTLLP